MSPALFIRTSEPFTASDCSICAAVILAESWEVTSKGTNSTLPLDSAINVLMPSDSLRAVAKTLLTG